MGRRTKTKREATTCGPMGAVGGSAHGTENEIELLFRTKRQKKFGAKKKTAREKKPPAGGEKQAESFPAQSIQTDLFELAVGGRENQPTFCWSIFCDDNRICGGSGKKGGKTPHFGIRRVVRGTVPVGGAENQRGHSGLRKRVGKNQRGVWRGRLSRVCVKRSSVCWPKKKKSFWQSGENQKKKKKNWGN